MLILERKSDRSMAEKDREKYILLGGEILIKIVSVRGDKVKIGIMAPRDIEIARAEIVDESVIEKIESLYG